MKRNGNLNNQDFTYTKGYSSLLNFRILDTTSDNDNDNNDSTKK